MKYQLEQDEMQAYLASSHYVDWQNPLIIQKAEALFAHCSNDLEKIRKAFLFVRDEIPHSGDINSHKITHTASEALVEGEGVCYVKSLLLAALLRSQGIATGMCYQRLARANDHIIHGLNAVYLPELKKWVRLDAREICPVRQQNFMWRSQIGSSWCLLCGQSWTRWIIPPSMQNLHWLRPRCSRKMRIARKC